MKIQINRHQEENGLLKKIVSVAMVVFMLLCVAACGKSGAGGEKNDEVVVAKHVPLSEEEYYQYSFLNDEEKELYKRVRQAVMTYSQVVDLYNVDVSAARAYEIVDLFLEDNPQCFWLVEDSGRIFNDVIILRYTDGEVYDDFDYPTADRDKIDEMRAEFDSAVNEIISKIDPTDSEYQKELAIHDYLTASVRYDRGLTGFNVVERYPMLECRSYGALVNKKTICTGYTHAFQYLCYMVGINSCRIHGEGHVWNAAKIDGEWYQVDVTWDDPLDENNNDGYQHHRYFNITSEQMYKAHPLSTYSYHQILAVPECTSTKYAYKGKDVVQLNEADAEAVGAIVAGVFVLIYISVGKANDKRKSKRRK